MTIDPSILGLEFDCSILGLTWGKILTEIMETHNQEKEEDVAQDLKSPIEELKKTRN